MNIDDADELDDETEELKEFHEILVGLEIGFAKDMMRDIGKPMIVRVMRKNGQNCIGTADFNPDRVNVAIVDGIITAIIGIG